MNRYCIFVILLLSLGSSQLVAQDFAITQVARIDDKVHLLYDLVDTVDRTYTIKLYASIDEFSTPLTSVEGDVGLEVTPGYNKEVVWHAAEDLGADFSGKVQLQIKGKRYIPFVRFSNLDDYKFFKRGKSYTITWTGGSSQNILNWDLYKGDELVHTIPNVANSGNYDLLIPKKTKSGKAYHLRVSDSKNSDEVVLTSEFQIKKRTPFIVKALPFLAVGAGVYLYLDSQNNDIPDPPTPSN